MSLYYYFFCLISNTIKEGEGDGLDLAALVRIAIGYFVLKEFLRWYQISVRLI